MITVADIRHIQRRVEREVDPMLCKGDLDFFSSCPATPTYQRPRTHERTTGIPQNLDDPEANEFTDVVGAIAEDFQLTQCAQVCSTGTEDDQAEQHDYGTISEVLGDPHTERGRDAPEEADREADPPEQIPLPGYPESRPCSFNHEVGIGVFEIIDSVSKRFLTSDAVCRGDAYVRVWVERESERSSPSYSTQACKRLRLVTSGWLAQTCSMRPRNARQRQIELNPHRERCDDQTCWIGNTRTNQQSGTTR